GPGPARLLEGVGDQVGHVGLAAAGHRNIGRGGFGVLAECQVGAGGGFSLRPIDGAGIRQLDVPAGVVRIHHPALTLVGEVQVSVGLDERRGPGVAVGDTYGVVVAAGGDPVTDPDSFPGLGHHDPFVVDPAPIDVLVPDGGVEVGDLITGV